MTNNGKPRLRSTTNLLAIDSQSSVLSGASEQDTKRRRYTPYGQDPMLEIVITLSGFTGAYREVTTGIYLLGNGKRAYNPVLMRFLSADSWSPFGDGGVNAYAYCGGDPVNRVDPSGHVLVPRRQQLVTTINSVPASLASSNSINAHGLNDQLNTEPLRLLAPDIEAGKNALLAHLKKSTRTHSMEITEVTSETGNPPPLPPKKSRIGERTPLENQALVNELAAAEQELKEGRQQTESIPNPQLRAEHQDMLDEVSKRAYAIRTILDRFQ